MALEQKLSLKLSQKLVMTPALQQAIKLLQMTRLELEGVLTQELEENPLLEQPDDDPGDERSNQENEENSENDDAPMDDIDLDAYFNEYLEASSDRPSGTYEPREAVPIEATLADHEDLYDHLLWQLHMMDLDEPIREIAELIIGNLDEDGFLAATRQELQVLGASTEEAERYQQQVSAWEADRSDDRGASPPSEDGAEVQIEKLEAAVASEERRTPGHELGIDSIELSAEIAALQEPEVPGYPVDAVEEALAVVRSLEPAGVGYRDLRSSLLAQLRAAGEEDTLQFRLVDEFWEACLKRQFAAIAKEIGVPLQRLKEPSERIGQLETRPGRKYGVDRTQYVEPDVHVVNVGGQFVVQVNDDGLPKLRVSRAYRQMLREMKSKGSDGEAQQYIREKMRSAMWLIKSLDQRQRTIYKVASSIVAQQQTFFEKGIDYLRPMVLRDVAEDIEMHESTVSRVVSNKYMHTPRGLYPMKFFFHSGIDRDMGGDISSLTVKRKIKQLIDAEDAKKPLSDSALMKRLKAEGIQIARRTVAKYREELRIPSSTDRKQVF